ncbi:MAG: phospho-N-acetylmuramoyl-pentapeptide-transferase [Bacteroidales bacterium]|nr:phospho-N-acetylmuramoyl-pentapeptide-transferase [Bacteroidales bacterium]
MLFYFFRFLHDTFDIPGAGMWGYISFRAIAALILALVISAFFGEYFIRFMKRRNISEAQRDPLIDPYGVQKKGVPTMGGIIIIVSTLIPCLLLGRLRNIYMILMIVTTVWLGFLGFMDDYLKMKKTKDGLKPILKLLGQATLGLAVGLTLYLSPDVVMRENVSVKRIETITNNVNSDDLYASAYLVSNEPQKQVVETVTMKSNLVKSTKTTLPFIKNHNLDYAGWFSWLGDWAQAAGWIFFVFVTTFVIMAVSNGANLNDGMDGMCAGNSAIMCFALGLLAYFSSHIEYASYFNIMYIPGTQELVVFVAAFVGALIGFLWYNAFPAQVFMGDTGSLAIGGIIGVLAIIIHKELLIPIICFIFLAESVSVMTQTSYAKYGNKKGLKLRVFKRAPIHDAFRVIPGQIPADFQIIFRRWPKGSWHESKITVRFWITTLILAAFAIMTLKIR